MPPKRLPCRWQRSPWAWWTRPRCGRRSRLSRDCAGCRVPSPHCNATARASRHILKSRVNQYLKLRHVASSSCLCLSFPVALVLALLWGAYLKCSATWHPLRRFLWGLLFIGSQSARPALRGGSFDRGCSLKINLMPAPKKADWPIVATVVAALVLVALAVYIGGYFALARGRHEYSSTSTGEIIVIRSYREKWQATIYQPAAKVEGKLVSKRVRADWVPDRWN